MKIDHFSAFSPEEWADGGKQAVMLLFHREPGRGRDKGMAETGPASGLGLHFKLNRENPGSAT